MTTMEYILWAVVLVLYVSFVFTVAMLTFRKGYTFLGIIGIFFPILWLVGAILPAKRGSRYDVEQEMRYQEQIKEWTK